MLNIPVLRWGKPYESLEIDQVVHFITGEPIANGQPGQRRLAAARHAQCAKMPARCCCDFNPRS